MSDDPKWDGLDRRDFITAAIGVSAVLAANADSASAQSVGQVATAPRGTVYTGDTIDGKKVISALNINDLEPGKKHLFYFQGVQMATGQHWHVSTMVAKGTKPGKRMALVSGVHGDEISPVRTIQIVMDRLDPVEMSGSVLAVLDVSRPAMEGMARRWPNSGRGIDLIDLNREWPGNESGPTAPSRHAGILFNRLLKLNADYAIDFHTSTTGIDMAALHIARLDLPEVRAMAELFPIDQIFDKPRLSRNSGERVHRSGHSCIYTGDWRASRFGPGHDPSVCGRDDERAQASRDHRGTNGPHREGHRHFCR